MHFDFNHFKNQGEKFLQALTAELIQTGIPVSSLPCDHLCFRVQSPEEYNQYKNALSSHGQLLTEAIVNGRAISTFSLNSSFKTNDHEVSLVELPSPKLGTPYEMGFEHAEFVIKDSFKTFSAKFPQLCFFEGGDRTLNPELSFKLSQGKQAKFHQKPLDRVIEIETSVIQDIIFDFDGTLIKSRENIHEINRLVFSKILNRQVTAQESIEKFHPEFSKLFEAYGITCPIQQKEAIAGWSSVSEHFSYKVFDGVTEILSELYHHGVRLHLWTARDENSARKILKDQQIDSFFTSLSFANEVNSKPQASSLNFDWKSAKKNQILVIGDSPADVHGAKNINAIRAAALWDPYSDRDTLTTAGAELFFHETSDLTKWLRQKHLI